MRVLVAVVCLVVIAAVAEAKPTVPITACGDEVPPNTIGLLQNDLDCGAYTGGFESAVNIVRVGGSTLTGNGRCGASGYRVRLQGATLSDNARCGVGAGKYVGDGRYTGGVRGSDSTLQGNGTAPGCGIDFSCADIVTPTYPKLQNVECGTSKDSRPGSAGGSCGGDNWCVCTND